MDMTETRAALRANVAALTAIQEDLAGIERSLPASPEETSTEDLGVLDGPAEVRAVLGAVLHDRLAPAILDLRGLLEHSPATEENPATGVAEDSDRREECVRLDLTAEEGAMRRIVRAVVIMDYFTARLSVDGRDEVWIPRYTAEQAGLRVWKAQGHWFASWRRLEVPATAPALPALLGDSLAPAAPVLDFPANVVLGNPPWRGRSEPRGPWITDLMADYFQLDGEPLAERNSKWLNDDAIRFLRLAQWKIEQAGEGIAALVLPHTGLEAPTFRGLRRSLLDSFDEIYALDLHGNQRKREKSPDGGADENVFRGVAQGVALFVLVKRSGTAAGAKRVLRADLYGTRRDKLRTLAATHVDTTGWEEVHPRPTAYLFTHAEERLEQEYRRGVPLPEIFPVSTSGVITGRDGMATDLDWRSLVAKLGALRQTGEPEAGLDLQRWEALRGDERWPRRVLSFLARPFDQRYLFYAHYFLERPRQAVMVHMENGGNLALLASRQTRGEPGALVTRWIGGHKAVSAYDVSTLFPLYLYPEAMPGKRGRDPLLRRPNLAPALLASLAERYGEAPRPEEVLGYVYAVLYDPTYRSRYKKLLREDFPRIPFPRKRGAFHHLAALGAELLGLHLLADRRLLDPPVRLVGDPREPLGPRPRSFLRYWEDEGRHYVNPEDLGFEGISAAVERYDIGGHPVLRRWLRSRCGRVLLPEEILTFRRIASALTFTLEVQAKIAEAGSGFGEAS
jgi:hypothetical protein